METNKKATLKMLEQTSKSTLQKRYKVTYVHTKQKQVLYFGILRKLLIPLYTSISSDFFGIGMTFIINEEQNQRSAIRNMRTNCLCRRC